MTTTAAASVAKRGEGKSVLIIGGGIAGLAAGCYAQMNGYRSQVLEMHTIPGGLCTSWRRKGYTMDGCLQYVTGSGDSDINRLWRELGALRGKQIFDREEFSRVESGDGRALIFYTNADRFEQHLLALAPGDRRPIQQLCNGIRAFTRLDMPLDTPTNPQENLEFGKTMLPFLAPVLRWNRVGLHDFAQRFDDPFVAEAMREFFQFAHPSFPLTVMMMTLAQMHNRNAGYPLGGSLRFALGIAKRYEELGGQLHCRTRVKRILVEEGAAGARAVGVELDGGEQLRADYVIAANDGYDTIFTMLEGKYIDETVLGYYREMPVAGPIVQVSLGVNMDLGALPHSFSMPLEQPQQLAGKLQRRMTPKHFAYDPTMAPAGKAAVTLWIDADRDYWRRAHLNAARYDAAQDEVADQVIAALDKRIPGLAQAVEVVDVATPATYERLTENWQGAIGGWTITKKKMSMMMGKGMKKQLPGLQGLYMIGQWVEPAGNVQLSAASGRDVFKLICAADGRPFVTAEAPALPVPPADEPLPAAAHADPAAVPVHA